MVEWNKLGIADGILSIVVLALIITCWVFYTRSMTDAQKAKYFWYLVASSILAGVTLIVLIVSGVGKIIFGKGREKYNPTKGMMEKVKSTSSLGTIVYGIILILILASIALSLYVIIDYKLISSNSS